MFCQDFVKEPLMHFGQAEIACVTMEYAGGDKVEIINRDKYTIPCPLATDPAEADGRICPRCRCHGPVRKDVTGIKRKDLTIRCGMTVPDAARIKYECQNCGATVVPSIDFRADNHRITKDPARYVRELLERGSQTRQLPREPALIKTSPRKSIRLPLR